LGRPADSFIVYVDTKFKVCLIRFIFDFKTVFIQKFLKIALIRVRFSPGFPSEAGFPGEEFAPAWL
jgi:hypothetical protein